uniref:Uncharacterized protein n=1 Tax=Fervidobacterium thailandense TaxID=1008305 RepID=A0A7C4GIL3_9BACT
MTYFQNIEVEFLAVLEMLRHIRRNYKIAIDGKNKVQNPYSANVGRRYSGIHNSLALVFKRKPNKVLTTLNRLFLFFAQADRQSFS